MNRLTRAVHCVRRAHPRRHDPLFELLEDRQLLTNFTVLNTNDSGAGSLRQAMTDANSASGGIHIVFDIPGSGVHTISPLSDLPAIITPMTINGYTEPGSSANTLGVGDNATITIEISGNGPGTTAQNAFAVDAGETTIRGLAINQFRGDAFAIGGASEDQIAGDFVGTDPTGTIAEGNGASSADSIVVYASDVTIGGPAAADRTIVSASGYYGIRLPSGTGDQIQNCYIGTDKSGTVALGNYNQGIYDAGASGITIGGTTAALRNVISGNGSNAIALDTTAGNLVEGNYIGTDASGTVALANGSDGVLVGASGNTIGGTAAGAGNLISGNSGTGVLIDYGSSTADGDFVQGNLIGTDKTGTIAIANTGPGIAIGGGEGGGYNALIGGTTAAARNVISGNKGAGIAAGGGTGNVIEGNYIGVDVTGDVALPNQAEGVNIGSSGVTVGGIEPGARNVIAGNAADGILIFGNGTIVQNNWIGLGADGSTKLGNGGDGVDVIGLVQIGGSFAGARNVISANNGEGIAVGGGGTRPAMIQGNYIGTDSSGTQPRGNKADGIYIGTSGITVGGPDSSDANVISANGTKADIHSTTGGITLGNEPFAGSADNNVIEGNLIGTAADGVSPLGNVSGGIIFASGASNTTVVANTIAYNNTSGSPGGGGIEFEYSAGGATGDKIDGNSIFANTGLGIDLGDDGVTPNSPGGPHSGPNDFQNYPVITSVSSNAIATFISGTLNAAPGTPFTLQFFSSPVADPSGYGQGETFLGQLTGVTTDTTGNTSFTFSTRFPVDTSQVFTATTTDPGGNTSEFSQDFPLPVLNPLIVTTTADSGAGSLRAAIEYVNATPGTSTISFDIPGSGVQTIAPLSALPVINNPVIIDGYTQPGSQPNTLPLGEAPDGILLIELSGALAGGAANGLEIAGGNSTVRGLVISGFVNSEAGSENGNAKTLEGNGIALTTNGGNLIEGDYIGTDPTGSLAEANSQGVLIESGPGDTIGGTVAGARNLISGNTNYGAGVYNFTALGTLIEGDLIGTDARGEKPLGNAVTGVEIDGGSVTLGGTTSGARNVISGNGGDGVTANTGNLIEGNYIGTDASGFVRLANAGDGVWISGPGNAVGGTTSLAMNVISGNAGSGVSIVETSDNVIEGNHIGSGAPSTSPINIGNGGDGVSIVTSSQETGGPQNNSIGGALDGAGNEIAFNGRNGVAIAASGGIPNSFAPTGSSILGNSIYSNALLGIDLGDDGPTANTPGGPHVGPNDLQNYPVITSAVSGDGNVTLGGTLNSTPDTTFVLQFVGNLHEVTPGVFGGQVVMGTGSVTTDATGNATFSENFLDFGGSYSATATDPGGNTSEFSPVTKESTTPEADLQLTMSSPTPNPVLTNKDFSYSVTITNVGPQDASNVVLSDAIGSGATFQVIATGGAITEVTPTLRDVTFASLASGASVTVSMEIRAAQAGAYTETASVTANETDPDETNNKASVTETVVAPLADLQVAMSSPTPNPVLTNKDFSYSVTITNVGPQDASNVVLSDAIGSGATFNVIATGGAITEVTPTLRDVTFASLASGASVTVSMEVRAAQVGVYTETASVTANETDPDETNNKASITETVIAPLADLQLTMSSPTPNPVLTNKDFSYSVTITNVGPQDASNVVLSDAIGSGATFQVIATGGAITEVTPTLRDVTFASLASGASVTVSMEIRAAQVGAYTETASVTANETDPDETNNKASVTETVVTPPADLQVTMSSPTPNPVLTNKDFSYSVTITNVGPQDASNVVLRDAIGSGATFQVIATGGEITEVTPTLRDVTFASLASGASVTVSMEVRAAQAGAYTETASVTANETDPDETNNKASITETVVGSSAELSVTGLASSQTATVGGDLTYSFSVTNNGPGAATGVTFSDTLPAGLTFVSTTASAGTAAFAAGVVTARVGAMAVGATVTVSIVVVPTVAGPLTDTATVDADQTDPVVADNHVTVVIATTSATPSHVFSSLVETTRGLDHVLVTWGYAGSALPGVRFNVYRDGGSGPEVRFSAQPSGSGHNFVDAGVVKGATYVFYVAAVVGGIESARSEGTTISVPGVTKGVNSLRSVASASVTSLYHRLLARAPSSPALRFWVGRLEAGMKLKAVARAIRHQSLAARKI